MKEEIITFETAKLAKEKGFSQNPYNTKFSFCPTYVDGSEITIKNSLFSPENNVAVAPTQSLLQRWLREVHKIIVYVNPIETMLFETRDYQLRILTVNTLILGTLYKSYEEALEVGLQEALELIK